jgi:hypothetical protein
MIALGAWPERPSALEERFGGGGAVFPQQHIHDLAGSSTAR